MGGGGCGAGLVGQGLKCIRNESKAIEKAAGEVLRGDEGGPEGGEE